MVSVPSWFRSALTPRVWWCGSCTGSLWRVCVMAWKGQRGLSWQHMTCRRPHTENDNSGCPLRGRWLDLFVFPFYFPFTAICVGICVSILIFIHSTLRIGVFVIVYWYYKLLSLLPTARTPFLGRSIWMPLAVGTMWLIYLPFYTTLLWTITMLCHARITSATLYSLSYLSIKGVIRSYQQLYPLRGP